jgi:hypothetical protein
VEKTCVEMVKQEICRLLERIGALEHRQNGERYDYYSSVETGAVRRASMDLTRALSNMRRYK